MKQGEQVGCTARVQLTVEYSCGAWGKECQLSQVYQQAAREAVQKLECALSNKRLLGPYRVVGEPRVIAVMTTNYTEAELESLQIQKSPLQLVLEKIREFKDITRGNVSEDTRAHQALLTLELIAGNLGELLQ